MNSNLARKAMRALIETTQRLTPEQRLRAMVTHSRLMAKLQKAGRELNSRAAAPRT